MIVHTRRVVITNAEMKTSYRLKYQMINPLKIPASTTNDSTIDHYLIILDNQQNYVKLIGNIFYLNVIKFD